MNADDKLAVECIDVHREFEDGTRTIHVLAGTNLKVRKGEFVAIVGASGSGKTTLLNLIGGLDTPTSGKIFVDGLEITDLNDEGISEVRRHKVGVLFQDQYLLPIFTALENVEVPMLLDDIPTEERHERALKLLDMVGVEHRAHHMPHELSGGMRSRVALARALANDPAVLLCDEPTGDLDHVTGGEIILQMKRLAKEDNRAIVVVTHDPEVAKMTDKILLLRDGVLVEELVTDFFKPSGIDIDEARARVREGEESTSAGE
jgi:putative ABC transport system ATP-binding protein